MADIVDKETRSRMMSGIRGKNTKPELLIREALHAAGFRYRLHVKDLPGKPDLVFPKYHAIIFIHGCFWHGHDCKRGARAPKDNAPYWQAKIERNRARDGRVLADLVALGWQARVLWECELKDEAALRKTLKAFLR